MENIPTNYEDGDRLVENGVVYRRLDTILEERGMTLQQFRQLRQRGFKLPVYAKYRKNTRGRGAEYLYREEEVLSVLKLVKAQIKAKEEGQDMPMVDRITQVYKTLGHAKKTVVQSTLNIRDGGSNYTLFNKLHNELVKNRVLQRVGFDGEYELSTGNSPENIEPIEE